MMNATDTQPALPDKGNSSDHTPETPEMIAADRERIVEAIAFGD